MKLSTRASPFTSKALFTIVGGAVLINPAFMQTRGRRNSRARCSKKSWSRDCAAVSRRRWRPSAMPIGVVDAINAEDIGKFPDTNLSEACSASPAFPSIAATAKARRSRRAASARSSTWSRSTAGRCRPRTRSRDGAARPAAASPAIRARSTSRISPPNRSARSRSTRPAAPTSRPAASARSINVRTARPLDNDGLVLNLGVKALNDTTNRVGDDFTPELSGIFSTRPTTNVSAWGSSASYQKRDSGSSTATVNDWHIQAWDSSNGGNNATNRATRRCSSTRDDTPYDGTDDSSPRRSKTRRPMASCTAFRTTSATRSRIRSASASTASSRAIRAGRRPDADRRLHVRAELASPKIAASRPSGCNATASTTSCSTPARRWRRRCAARVHRRQQGLRLRAATSRAEERSEVGRLQCRLGGRATRSLSASTSTIRRRAVCRTIRSPAAAQTASASRARCRAPA